jgi:hypothetical protein
MTPSLGRVCEIFPTNELHRVLCQMNRRLTESQNRIKENFWREFPFNRGDAVRPFRLVHFLHSL